MRRKTVNYQFLGAAVVGLLAFPAGAVLAETLSPSDLAASPHQALLANVGQAVGAAPLANDSTLPVISFATQNGLFAILPTGEDRQTLIAETDALFFAIGWAPAGDHVAVVRNFGEVFRIGLGQTTPTAIFDSECFRPPTLDLAWQQDGATLLIKQLCDSPVSGLPGSLELFLANQAGQLISLANLPTELQSDLYISPDATEVAYVANQHIYILGTDDSLPRQVTQVPGIYGAAGSPLAWSPDGSKIAFYEGNYPFQQINVINADGTGRRTLTPDPNFQIYRSRLVWSPDSRKIAFYRPINPPNSNQEAINLIDLNSGEMEPLTSPGFFDALSWSPDGQQLAFASGSQFEQKTLFLLDLNSTEMTTLTPQPFQNVLSSAWSPVGDWIAFSAAPIGNELGTQVLYAVRPDASDLKALTAPDEYVYPFAWIPQP